MNQEKEPRSNASVPEEETSGKKTEEQTALSREEAKPEETAAPESETPEQQTPEERKKQPKKEKERKNRSAYFQTSRFRHGSVATAFTVVFIAVVVLLNLLVSALVNKYPSVNLDLTSNGSNSLSAASLKIVDSVKIPATVYVMGTRDQVNGDQIESDQGVKYSQVGSLLDRVAERNPNIKVEYMDLDKNPTFAAEYKSDNLTSGDVLVKTSKRYRVLTYTDLFNIQYSSDYSSSQVYSNVEGALDSAFTAVISDKLPVVAFDTGHSEQQDMSAYKKMLDNNSFETKDFNLLTDKIPDGAQMIVLGWPTKDYTDEEIQKLSDFLGSKTLAGDRSLMVTFYPSQSAMPKLANFLQEWGIEVPSAVVVESDQQKYIANNPTYILSDIQSDLSLRQTNSQGGYDYGYFLTPESSPVNLLFDTKGTKKTYALAKSSDTSYQVDSNTKSSSDQKKEASVTAALSQDTVASGSSTYKANVIAVGSSKLFTDGIVNSDAFGDGTYTVDLAKYATGTADSSSQINVSQKPLNATDMTITAQMSTFLGLGVFSFLMPLAIAVFGFIVFYKRRHL